MNDEVMQPEARDLRGQARSQMEVGNEGRTGIVSPDLLRREIAVPSREKMLEIRKRILARYKAELAKAPWWKKFWIRLKMHDEFKRELTNAPSPHSLYATKHNPT
jgi:hypothetical protein